MTSCEIQAPTFGLPAARTAKKVAVAGCLAVLLATALVWPSAGHAAIQHVQSNYNSPHSDQSTILTTYDDPQLAGSLNVVIVAFNNSTSNVQSVSDTKGNTYTLAVGPTVLADFAKQYIYYAKNIVAAGGGENTVTVVLDAVTPYPDVRIAEYSGINTSTPFDAGVGSTGTAASGLITNSGSLTTTNANDLLVAGNFVEYHSEDAGANYTMRFVSFDGHILEDRIVSATGTYDATATVNAPGSWIMQLAAFKGASGGGDTQAPTAPSNLNATAVSSTQINLSWTASTDNVSTTSYLVERCQGSGCSNFSQIATPATNSYNDTGRSPSTSYSYRVRAQDAVPNYSAYSGTASATTPVGEDVQAPTAPTNLSATAASSTQINLSWTASTDNLGVTGYLVERCQGASCSNFAEITMTPGTTYNDPGLSALSAYSYRVRARDAADNRGGYSNTASATTLQAGGPGSSSYTYDELGRLRTGTYPGNQRVDYQYDAAGNRTEMNSGTPATLVIGTPTSVTEGGTLSFPVTRTGTSAQNITVGCSSQNGTAQSGGAAPFDDYTAIVNQQLTFLISDPNPTTKNCTILTKADSYYEGTQTVIATLQNAAGGAAIATGSATGSILEANAGPVFSVSGSSIAEGSGLSFTISKSGLTEQSHNVSYSTANGTATTADNDYTAVGATPVAFTSGQTSQAVSVSTTSDTKYENSETVAVNLSSPTDDATLGTSSASGTINNDDAAPSITIDDRPSVNEGGIITFNIRKIGNANTDFTHSISWATANNTAIAGTDYTAASGTETFGTTETLKQITVQTLNDGVFDNALGGVEYFNVNLTTNGGTNGAVITDATGVGAISDMQAPPTQVSMLGSQFRQESSVGQWGIGWTEAGGPVAYYILQEGDWNFTSPANYNTGLTAFKSFTNKPPGEYYYRAKACNSLNTCSAWSPTTIQITVCAPSGCQ